MLSPLSTIHNSGFSVVSENLDLKDQRIKTLLLLLFLLFFPFYGRLERLVSV